MKCRKCLSVLLALLMVLAMLPANAAKADDVLEIGTYDELKAFAARVNNGETSLNAILTADIVATDTDWTPIGADDEHAYTGTFDGCGHTITGLCCTVDMTGERRYRAYAGLFGCIGGDGVVQNVGMLDVSITANDKNKSKYCKLVYAGAIAAYSEGTVRQCYLDGTGAVGGYGISKRPGSTFVYAGGLVGYSSGTVRDSYSCGCTDVKADIAIADDYDHEIPEERDETCAGGIVGYSSGTIASCYSVNTGVISAEPGDLEILVKSDATPFLLLPGAEKTYEYDRTIYQDEMKYGIESQAIARARDTDGNAVQASEYYVYTIGDYAHSAALRVSVKASPVTDGTDGPIAYSHFAAGETVIYIVDVTNTGSLKVKDIVLSDSLGQLNEEPFTLDSKENRQYLCTYTVTQADVDAGRIDISASAAGKYQYGSDVTAEDTFTVATTEAATPALKIWREQTRILPTTGGVIVEKKTVVKNTGNVPLNILTVEDENLFLENNSSYATEVCVGNMYRSMTGAIAGGIGDESAFSDCCYDSWVCGLEQAVGNAAFPGARLTTDDMTGSLPGGFSSDVWLRHRWDPSNRYYPHLKGFAYDQSQANDDWPAKISGIVVQSNPYVDITVTDAAGNPVTPGMMSWSEAEIMVFAVPKDGYRLKQSEGRDMILYNDEIISEGELLHAEFPCVISAEAEPCCSFELTVTCNDHVGVLDCYEPYSASSSGRDVVITGYNTGMNLRLYADVLGSALWTLCEDDEDAVTRFSANPYVAPFPIGEGETHYTLDVCRSPSLITEAHYIGDGFDDEAPQLLNMTMLPAYGGCTVLPADGGRPETRPISLPDSYAAYLEPPDVYKGQFMRWEIDDPYSDEPYTFASGAGTGTVFQKLEELWQSYDGDITVRFIYQMWLSVEVTPEGAGTAVFDPLTGVFTAAAGDGCAFDHWEYKYEEEDGSWRVYNSEENPFRPDDSVLATPYSWIITAVFTYSKPMFASHSLTLGGQIGVNFYMNIQGLGLDLSTCYMTFAISGAGTVSSDPVPISIHHMNADGTYYGFACYVTPIQMADTITATFHYGDNQTVSDTYSVRQYIGSFAQHADEYDSETRELVHAIADYGHYVQLYLESVKDWTLGSGDDQYAPMDMVYMTEYDVGAIADAVADYEIVRETNDDIQKITYSVRLDSDTAILVYFKPIKNYDGSFTVTLDGDSCTATQEGGRYVVEIPNIGAHLLGTTYKIVAETEHGSATVEVSALSYVNSMLTAYAGNTNAENAACAIYAYCAAASAYILPN